MSALGQSRTCPRTSRCPLHPGIGGALALCHNLFDGIADGQAHVASAGYHCDDASSGFAGGQVAAQETIGTVAAYRERRAEHVVAPPGH